MLEYRVNMRMPDGEYELRISAIDQHEFRRKLIAFLRQLGTAPAVMQNIDDALARQPIQPHIRKFAIDVTALAPVNGNTAPANDDLVLVRNMIVGLFEVRREVPTVESIQLMLQKVKSKHALKLAQEKTTADNLQKEVNVITQQRNDLQVEVRTVRTDLVNSQAKCNETERRLNATRQELLDKERLWARTKTELEEEIERLEPQVAQLNAQNHVLNIALIECRNNRDRTSNDLPTL